MQSVGFCKRCRGMRIGWNTRYLFHCVLCKGWMRKSFRVMVLAGVLSSLVFAFPVSTGLFLSVPAGSTPLSAPAELPNSLAGATPVAAVAVIEDLLAREQVDEELRLRIARAIVDSSRKHDIDPLLLASIMVVESRGNPFAVSEAGSMGVMQVHLPTWRGLIDAEGINLFKIEDNVDLGARILKGYVAKNGIWDGVARYKGRNETPESYESAAAYVRKVQRIYGLNPQQASLD